MKNLKYILLTIILFLSCQEQEIPVNDDGELEFSNKLIYEETFEGEKIWASGIHKQFAEEHSFSVVTQPVFQGKFSGKFELRYGDRRATANGLRSEVLFPKQYHKERWYSFSVYFPSYGNEDDRYIESFTQWHNGSGSPTANFRIRNGRLSFRIGYSKEIPTAQWDIYDFGPVPKDIWTEFVFHFVHSNGDDGLVEIWRDGEKILTHKGPNIYEDSQIPRWKVGIYKSVWASQKTDVDLRVYYYDNVRLGSEIATLDDMR